MAVGRPDYTRATEPTRTVLGPGQLKFVIAGTVDVSAGTTVTTDLYTIPAGYILNFISGYGSANKDVGILKSELLDSTAVFFVFYIQFNAVFTTAESGGYVFDAGDVFSVKIYNTSSEDITVAFTLLGTMYKV